MDFEAPEFFLDFEFLVLAIALFTLTLERLDFF